MSQSTAGARSVLGLGADVPLSDSRAIDVGEEFARVYDSVFPRVLGYIRYCVGSQDVADDLTAQTFLKALDRLSTFERSKAPIETWLLAVARNVVRDHLRSRRRWKWLPLDLVHEEASRTGSPEDRAIDAESHNSLLGALGSLSIRERDVLGLKFAGGLTNRAIASATGLREAHVAVIIYRAIGKMRDRLLR